MSWGSCSGGWSGLLRLDRGAVAGAGTGTARRWPRSPSWPRLAARGGSCRRSPVRRGARTLICLCLMMISRRKAGEDADRDERRLHATRPPRCSRPGRRICLPGVRTRRRRPVLGRRMAHSAHLRVLRKRVRCVRHQPYGGPELPRLLGGEWCSVALPLLQAPGLAYPRATGPHSSGMALAAGSMRHPFWRVLVIDGVVLAGLTGPPRPGQPWAPCLPDFGSRTGAPLPARPRRTAYGHTATFLAE